MERRYRLRFLCETDVRAIIERRMQTGVNPTPEGLVALGLITDATYSEAELRRSPFVACQKCGDAHKPIGSITAERVLDFPEGGAWVTGLVEENQKQFLEELFSSSPTACPTAGLRVLRGGKE